MRFYRAGSPAFASVLVGGLLLLLVPVLPPIVGGLAAMAGYALALQVVLTFFLLTAIDDFGDVHHSIPQLYRTKMAPALFLAFGVAVSLTGIAIGLVDDDGQIYGYHIGTLIVRVSEVIMAGALLLTALAQLWRFGNGFFGWCVGFALGVAWAETNFSVNAVVEATFLGWLGYAAGLSLLGGAMLAIMAFRRRSHQRSMDVSPS